MFNNVVFPLSYKIAWIDLAKVASELSEVMKERDVAETAKFEVLSRLEKLSTVHSEEKRKHHSELIMLQYRVNELRKGVNDIHNLLSIVFSKDLELLKNLEANINSCLEGDDSQVVTGSQYSMSSNLEGKVIFSWPVFPFCIHLGLCLLQLI